LPSAQHPLTCRAPSWQLFFAAFAECLTKKILGKEVFADEIFTVYPLSSAALGKAFVEGKLAFGTCVSSSDLYQNTH
jgi:hypothetical protein